LSSSFATMLPPRFISRLLLSPRAPQHLSPVSQMSMWAKEYEEPVSHKSQFKELKESGEYERKKFVPIKAALSEANCSLFRDELVDRMRKTLMKYSNGERSHRLVGDIYRHIKETQLKKYYKASEEGQKIMLVDPTLVIHRAVDNARPLMAIERVRVGAVTYSVPSPIREHRATFDALKWIIGVCRDRGDRAAKKKTSFAEKMAQVLMETSDLKGPVIALKNEHHRVCEANKAYAHYRRSK
jgi:small subunit ribosomal protein S7